MTGRFSVKRPHYYPPHTLRESTCGICRLEGPDRFGNYDLLVSERCPLHAEGKAG